MAIIVRLIEHPPYIALLGCDDALSAISVFVRDNSFIVRQITNAAIIKVRISEIGME